MTTKPVLILGGTGKTGRRLAERLTARNIPVRIGSRAGTPPFDWLDKETWGPSLEGVGAVYISYIQTSPCRAPPKPSRRLPGLPSNAASSARCCAPVAASLKPSAPRRC